VIGGLTWDALDYQTSTGYLSGNNSTSVPAGWPGNTVDQKGRFMDEHNPFLPKTLDLLRWQLGSNQFEAEKRSDRYKLEVKDPTDFLASNEDGIIWLGHASFYIRLNGVGMLTDPVFGEPFPINRFVAVPSPLDSIRHVDYVLLSHDHRDHMDETTLRAVAVRFPNAAFLGGLRSEDVLSEWTTSTNSVATAGWFQKFATRNEAVGIYFLPVRHWSRRSLFDTNWRLWGGYVIQSEKATIYFGGDSGYGQHYRETAELFPNIDFFLIGIGAYEPRWFMEPNHNNPSYAIKAFQDAGAQTLVPMHYGTFDLSDEPPGQPLKYLLSKAAESGIRDRVRTLAINESISIQ